MCASWEGELLECELVLLLELLVSGGGGAGEWDMAKEGAKRKCMTDGRLKDISIPSTFRWRAAAVAARRCKLHCGRVLPPEERYLFFLFRYFLVLSGTGPPGFPLTARADIARSLALLPNVLPSFLSASVPHESPGTLPVIRCRPRRGHN